MQVECIALTGFVHGSIKAVEGRPVLDARGEPLQEALATELERAGLVRINLVKTTDTKAPAGGADAASSASPAAPALTSKTLHLPASGEGKRRRNATS